MTTPVTQEDTQEDHVGDGNSSVHDYDNVPLLAVGCQLMSRTLCSMQSLNLQYTEHVNITHHYMLKDKSGVHPLNPNTRIWFFTRATLC